MTVDELAEHIRAKLTSKEPNERNEAMARLIHALYPITTGLLHHSDCAVYNAPAEPPGLCDCGAIK